MKTTRTVLCALLLLGAIPLAASAQISVGAGVNVGPHGRASVDLGFFYDSLASYGSWIERPSYGWVWTPRAVSASWRPYQAGHWVWSDQGWTWLSDEPYGWATYHYGRWYQDPEIGWAWVPGNDWAPAWVSWQEGDNYVGWAPLPPGANVATNASYDNGPGYDDGPGYDSGPGPGYDDGYGYDNGPGYYDNGPGYDNGGYAYGGGPAYGYDGGGYGYYGGGYGYGGYAYGLAPSAYLFVPVQSFLAVNLFDYFVPFVSFNLFFGHTHNCTYYGYHGGYYYNRGIPYAHVQHYYHNVPRYHIADLHGFQGHGHRVNGNSIDFFRPQVQRTRGISPLNRPNARGSVMRADQFRAAFPDRVARAQRETANNRQAFRGQVQGASPRQQRGEQVQGRNGRQGVIDYGQRYQQGQANGRQYRDQIDRQRQNDNQQRWQQNQAERQQRQYQSQQRWQQQRQSTAPRVQERSYQQPQRQAAPQREYRNENRGQGNGGGRGQGGGRSNNEHRHGHGG